MIHLVFGHLIICLLTPASQPAAPHVYADNYIDRSVSIVIRDQTARIEFSVAMNDTTIRRLMQQWQSPPMSEEPDSRASSTSKNLEESQAVVPKEETATNRLPKDASNEFANDSKLVAEFRKVVATHIAKDLLVTFEKEPVTIREVNPDTPPRHHMSATVQFEFDLPASKIVDLSVVDSNFSNFDGGARYALKVGGNLVMSKSNVAPILVRADRIEFADLSKSARAQVCKIKAQIVQPRQP